MNTLLITIGVICIFVLFMLGRGGRWFSNSPFWGTYKNKNRPNFGIIWVGWFVSNMLGLIDSLIGLCSLCLLYPNLQMKWLFYWSKIEIESKRNK
jgi:hypothetical protein